LDRLDSHSSSSHAVLPRQFDRIDGRLLESDRPRTTLSGVDPIANPWPFVDPTIGRHRTLILHLSTIGSTLGADDSGRSFTDQCLDVDEIVSSISFGIDSYGGSSILADGRFSIRCDD